MKRILTGLSICAALLAVTACEQGTDLASDPVPLDIEAPEPDPDALASASATEGADAQEGLTENAVPVGGTFRFSDTESAAIAGVTNVYDAEVVDGDLVVTARSTVSLRNQSLTGDLAPDVFPSPAAAVVPLWLEDSPVCEIAGGSDEERLVERLSGGDASDDDATEEGAIGCHGVVPALSAGQTLESDGTGALGSAESIPAVGGEESVPVSGDAEEIAAAMASPDGWAFITTATLEGIVGNRVYDGATCDIVGSALGVSGPATIMSTEDLPGCG